MLMRMLSAVYLLFLTALLLTSDPMRLIGVSGQAPWVLRTVLPWAHLLSFLLLAVLVLNARWPMPRWLLVLLMAGYGGVTEIVQGFVPHRTLDWLDWIQDLGGIAVGAAICWSGSILGESRRGASQETTTPRDDGEVMQRVMSRPRVEERSWWG